MITKETTPAASNHLPPHHISEELKKEMDEANKQPPNPNSFLDRLRKR
jgi:hypothetical protein